MPAGKCKWRKNRKILLHGRVVGPLTNPVFCKKVAISPDARRFGSFAKV
jgi:hypothetical protein